MPDILAGVVLAAGAGTRLRPLTLLRPKALCPVGNVPLVDLALRRVREVTPSVAVNAHHRREQLEAHVEALEERVHLSIEEPQALGTAGALGHLREWISGRDVLVVNADSWSSASLGEFSRDWDRERTRLLLVGGGPLGPRSRVVAALMPWPEVSRLPAEPGGLYECSWREAESRGDLEVIGYQGPFVDCGSPAGYLEANLAAGGGASVIGEDVRVEGSVERSVLWSGVTVHAGEHLVDAIRASDRLTVFVR